MIHIKNTIYNQQYLYFTISNYKWVKYYKKVAKGEMFRPTIEYKS